MIQPSILLFTSLFIMWRPPLFLTFKINLVYLFGLKIFQIVALFKGIHLFRWILQTLKILDINSVEYEI